MSTSPAFTLGGLAVSLPDPALCDQSHDPLGYVVSIGLCIGMLVSYVPQHFKIIRTGTSEGFSPWFLLLGSIGSWSNVTNMIILQWGIIQCCRVVPGSVCFEHTLGISQVAVQWAAFLTVVALFIIYYPTQGKKIAGPDGVYTTVSTQAWRDALVAAWSVVAHITIIIFISTTLISRFGADDPRTRMWAGLLGLTGMGVTFLQYIPQLIHTWKAKRVGSLSIPMMCMQTPGAFVFVYSLASREGTNWTSWITFLVAGIMQGSLLILCIVWRARERKEARLNGESQSDGSEVSISSVTLNESNERTALLS